LVLLQHPSCYTLGRGSSESFLRFPPTAPPAPLFRIDRGGEVTRALVVEDALFCGACTPRPDPIDLPELDE
jgi:hypothetical protein